MSILLLAYISDATREYSDSEMDELLNTCRRNNEKLNVTGMLIYGENKFLQVLEGDPIIIHELYDKIEKDPRHKNSVVMDTSLIEERNFSDWSMGYQRTSAESIAKELKGYVDVFDENKLVMSRKPIKQLSVKILLNAFNKVIAKGNEVV